MNSLDSPTQQEHDVRHCELCRRVVPLTFHHLVPRKMHRRTHFQKHYDREELNRGLYLCHPCHRGLHRLYDEMTLAKELNTREALLADEKVRRHVAWVAKQK